ncbi:MAG: bis(5'-nucleosyl)-tetraphosphatase (symmetrical) YqeK [Coriobacteriaceae bacterium]|jgi:predicted HD superfamily hydrolase involved in NAD metabolism|nr:bis(5'-nucleosyl)-tetraphosphatase (symmetrical) YqeK [Coriobacteriaceae bacterium]
MSEYSLTEEFFQSTKARLKERASDFRFKHALSVAETAEVIARAYGVDERKARLAGLIHDWDKDYSNTEIRLRATELGVASDAELVESMPHMLHGMTGAVALKQEFPEIGDDILQAVAFHTSGALDMSDLDKVLYIADVIEPERQGRTRTGLSEGIGLVSLDELFFRTYQQVFKHLVERGSRIHPDTIKVWNHSIMKMQQG